MYSHAYTIAFELCSGTEDGADVTDAMLIAALLDRIEQIKAEGNAIECCGPPFDSTEA